MNRVLVIAPHPDDETLGCGGTILRHVAAGDAVHWLIVTSIASELGYSEKQIDERETEIDAVAAHYGFSGVHRLGLPVARLDAIPRADLVEALHAVANEVAADTMYLPNGNDVHSDHRVVFEATVSCAKWFRTQFLRRLRVYETLSETEFGVGGAWRPNLFVDIAAYLDGKVEAMQLYSSEVGNFPFPRSEEAIRALALLRGSTAGCHAAESFVILREIE